MADPKPASTEDGKRRILAIIAEAKPFPPLELPEEPKAKRSRLRRETTQASGDNPGKKSSVPPVSGSPDSEADIAWQEGPGEMPEPPPVDDPHDTGMRPPELIEANALEPLNDVGNARRLLRWFGEDILHVREIGWHWWTGTHWSKQGGEEIVTRYAQITAERIKLEREFLPFTRSEAMAIEDGEAAERDLKELAGKLLAQPESDYRAEKRRLESVIAGAADAKKALGGRKGARVKFATSSGNTTKIKGMIAQAIPQDVPGLEKPVSVDPDALDKDPHAFNVENGTLRFVRVRDLDCPDPDVVRFKWIARLDEHNRRDLIAKLAPVRYDPEAKSPEWFKFLDRVQPDRVMRNFLRDFHGYGLTGLTGIQAFVYNTGGGANGKSTFIECLSRIVGDYGHSLNPQSLTGASDQRGAQATPDLANLPGVRLLRVSELPKGSRLQEGLIKTLTGGEGSIMVRHNFGDFFPLRPVFKASMSGNDKPEIHDSSDGMWRRLRMVKWGVQIPEAEQREFEDMQALFKPEWPGILNWMVEGCIAYLDVGKLITPDDVLVATAEHRDDMDPVGHFLEACVEHVPGSKVTGGELYAVYEAWCRESGLKPFQQTTFGRAVPTKGWAKAKSGVVSYLDMRILRDAPVPPETYHGPKSPRSPPFPSMEN